MSSLKILYGGKIGNAFVYECRDPEVIREPGHCGETDFIYAKNNALSKELEEFQKPHPECGLSYVPHCGWIGAPQIGGSLSSVSKNAEMWNLFHNYYGEIDLEFAKMMWRFPGPQPDYPTLEEADAAYWPTQANPQGRTTVNELLQPVLKLYCWQKRLPAK